jgi:hypothetical protein
MRTDLIQQLWLVWKRAIVRSFCVMHVLIRMTHVQHIRGYSNRVLVASSGLISQASDFFNHLDSLLES